VAEWVAASVKIRRRVRYQKINYNWNLPIWALPRTLRRVVEIKLNMCRLGGIGLLSWCFALKTTIRALMYLRLVASWRSFILGGHCFLELRKRTSSPESLQCSVLQQVLNGLRARGWLPRRASASQAPSTIPCASNSAPQTDTTCRPRPSICWIRCSNTTQTTGWRQHSAYNTNISEMYPKTSRAWQQPARKTDDCWEIELHLRPITSTQIWHQPWWYQPLDRQANKQISKELLIRIHLTISWVHHWMAWTVSTA